MILPRSTRRQALQGAGAALLGLVLLGPRAALAEQGRGLALDSKRAATMTALVTALTLGPAAGVDPETYTADFGAYYAAGSAPFRELADGALDRLAPLADIDAAAGYAALKDMTLDPARRLDAADGLMLAGLSFENDGSRQAGYFLATE